MTADPTARIRELFQAALEHDATERSAFLSGACGDDISLRDQVEALLAAHAEASDLFYEPAWTPFLEDGPSLPPDEEAPEDEPDLPFERLGAYRLVRRLGGGGMGTVYLAIQEPVNRSVALKVVRSDLFGDFDTAKRFAREVEAVSRLCHPGIVTLFDSGKEQGVRYFAMELVPGDDLDGVLRRTASRGGRVPRAKILAWIREIARALESAHEAGIIHRDVKPSNIRINPEGHAKLMDFGIARNLNLSTLTIAGEFRGTPHYAAPEQLKVGGRPIDARCDVYGLGVTLYEAMTGRVPFEGETPEQVFRQILEDEPIPPRRLNPSLSRDLQTIILHAMEKEPARRYADMGAFADDLDRLARGEVIRARPAGPMTRFWKRVKRNPLSSAALSVAALSVAALVVSIPWYIVQLKGEQRETEKEAARFKAINEFLETMFASPAPGEEGKEVKMADMLDKATAELSGAFPDEPEIEASLRHIIGRTYYRLGRYAKAEEQHKLALEVRRRVLGPEHPDTLVSMNNLGLALRRSSRFAEAETLYRDALEIQRRDLGEEHPETLDTMNNLGNVLRSLGKIDEAEAIYRKTLEARRRVLGDDHPDTLWSRDNLTKIAMMRGFHAQAAAELEAILADRRSVLGDEHPDTLASMNNLAFALVRLGRSEKGETLYREALEIHGRVLGREHLDTMTLMNNLAELLEKAGRFEEAEALAREAADTLGRIFGPEHYESSRAMLVLARALIGLGRLDEAEPVLEQAVAARRRLLGDSHPESYTAMNDLADLLVGLEKFEEAKSLYREIAEIEPIGLNERRPHRLIARNNLAHALLLQGKHAEAEPLLAELVDEAGQTLPPGDRNRHIVLKNYGECLLRLERYAEAERALLQAYQNWVPVKKRTNRLSREILAALIEFYEGQGQPEKVAEYRRMLEP